MGGIGAAVAVLAVASVVCRWVCDYYFKYSDVDNYSVNTYGNNVEQF